MLIYSWRHISIHTSGIDPTSPDSINYMRLLISNAEERRKSFFSVRDVVVPIQGCRSSWSPKIMVISKVPTLHSQHGRNCTTILCPLPVVLASILGTGDGTRGLT